MVPGDAGDVGGVPVGIFAGVGILDAFAVGNVEAGDLFAGSGVSEFWVCCEASDDGHSGVHVSVL